MASAISIVTSNDHVVSVGGVKPRQAIAHLYIGPTPAHALSP